MLEQLNVTGSLLTSNELKCFAHCVKSKLLKLLQKTRTSATFSGPADSTDVINANNLKKTNGKENLTESGLEPETSGFESPFSQVFFANFSKSLKVPGQFSLVCLICFFLTDLNLFPTSTYLLSRARL